MFSLIRHCSEAVWVSPSPHTHLNTLCLQNTLFSLTSTHDVPSDRHFLVDKLEFSKVRDVVAVHVPCSSKKMGIEESFAKLAGLCANEVRTAAGHYGCCRRASDLSVICDMSLSH